MGTIASGASSDSNWILVSDNASSTAMKNDYGTAVFHDKIWVIAGRAYSRGSYLGTNADGTKYYTGGDEKNVSEVWSSSDGKNWDLVTENPGFIGRVSPGIVVFQDRLWVIGGTGFDDVWSSSDGSNWTREIEHAGFGPRGDIGLVVFHDRLWVITGGTSYPREEPAAMTDDVWSSPDGKVWTCETEHAGFGPRFGYGVVVYHDRLWLIDGKSDVITKYYDKKTDRNQLFHTIGGAQDVWVSDNGANWTRVKDNLPFGRREFAPVTVFHDKLWLIGGGYRLMHFDRFESFSGSNTIWTSMDGINWSLDTEDPGFYLGNGPVVVFENAIWHISHDIRKKEMDFVELGELPANIPPSLESPAPSMLPDPVPPYLRTTSPADSGVPDTPNSISTNLSTPKMLSLPTRAGMNSIAISLNVLIAMTIVLIFGTRKTR